MKDLIKGEFMKRKILMKCLLMVVVSSVGALADMTIDKSNGVLTVTSSISGKVTAKVIGPNDVIIVNETYEGNSFTWSPSGGDGAYRYNVRVEGDYTGGSVEVRDGQIQTNEEEK